MLRKLSYNLQRSSSNYRACKVRFTVEIKSLFLPFEALKVLGQNAAFSFSFRRGNKIVTSFECEMVVTSSGTAEVICHESMSLDVTMHRNPDAKYLEKRGKIVVHVFTENGWEDLGKIYVDLHNIANDLQPISVNSELSKCIIPEIMLHVVVTPKVLDNDDYSESISDVSELTEDSPMKRSLSFPQRLRMARIRSGSDSQSTGKNAEASRYKVAPSNKDSHENFNNHTSSTVSSMTATPTKRDSDDDTPIRKKRESKVAFVEGKSKDGGPTDMDLQDELQSVQTSFGETCQAYDRLKNKYSDLEKKILRKKEIIRDLNAKNSDLESDLRRKNTEIKMVLNVQKKMESRIEAFIEKEKNLKKKEMELEARVAISDGRKNSNPEFQSAATLPPKENESYERDKDRAQLLETIEQFKELYEKSEVEKSQLEAKLKSLSIKSESESSSEEPKIKNSSMIPTHPAAYAIMAKLWNFFEVDYCLSYIAPRQSGTALKSENLFQVLSTRIVHFLLLIIGLVIYKLFAK